MGNGSRRQEFEPDEFSRSRIIESRDVKLDEDLGLIYSNLFILPVKELRPRKVNLCKLM